MRTLTTFFFILTALFLTACSPVKAIPSDPGSETLATLTQLDAYPVYAMTYKDDYNLDVVLAKGITSDEDVVDHFNTIYKTKLLATGETTREGKACTGFTASSQNGDHYFGHNEDWRKSNYLVLTTTPKKGYASVSLCGISYHGGKKTDGLLLSPLYPLSGMNSQGLCVSTYSVASCAPPQDEKKRTLIWPVALRVLLDRAATVDQALDLLDSYNIFIEDGNSMQFFIGDAQGDSVIVEWLNGSTYTIRKSEDWQAVTNFVQESATENDFLNCWRYRTASEYLRGHTNQMSDESGMQLLEKVSQAKPHGEGTQFSVLFNQTRKDMTVAFGRGYWKPYHFTVK